MTGAHFMEVTVVHLGCGVRRADRARNPLLYTFTLLVKNGTANNLLGTPTALTLARDSLASVYSVRYGSPVVQGSRLGSASLDAGLGT